MHEMSLVSALLDEADRAIGAHPSAAVRAVTVRIGELAGVDAELFRTAFSVARHERGYPNAELFVVDEPATWWCEACERVLARGARLRCAACDAAARLRSGDGLVLERIELEVRDV